MPSLRVRVTVEGMRWLVLVLVLISSGCAYRFGYGERSLPGGHTELAIPVFVNRSMEPGVESYFTNELIRQFARSKAARLGDRGGAPVVLEGSVDEITYTANFINDERRLANIPKGTVLTTEYRVMVRTSLKLRRMQDRKILWEAEFRDESVYQAPQVTVERVNSANPLYNHTARHQTVAQMAKEMMAEAHDRMTENF